MISTLIPSCLDSVAPDSPLRPCALWVTVIVLAFKSDHVRPLPKPIEGWSCQSTSLYCLRGPVIGLLFPPQLEYHSLHTGTVPSPPPACLLSCLGALAVSLA